jgi:RNA-directed DNA polymerase
METAKYRVMKNKGSPGIDGMSVFELPEYLDLHWAKHKQELLQGKYQPTPVMRLEIPKPDGSGVRILGVPTVLDRLVQQMVLQVLQKRIDPLFSENSYGFRPGRSAHQAIKAAQEHIREGYEWVVDIDIEKFFDRVNHDILMSLLAKQIKDKRVLKLVRAFLNAGAMSGGLLKPTEEGTPQGGPLSPLLSNLVLDVLDKELENRGHRFVRYADDCNIYVRSKRAGDRVMESVTWFIERKLKLKVNQNKSAVGKANERSFLGFSFIYYKGEVRRKISPKKIKLFKQKVRQLTGRSRGRSLAQVVKELSEYLRGWVGYYGVCETPSVLEKLNEWIRHRLRSMIWKQWKGWKNRLKELTRHGVTGDLAKCTAVSQKGPWHISTTKALCIALRNKLFDDIGLFKLATHQFA